MLYLFLSEKLRKFTLAEFIMVKGLYLVLGVFVASLYPHLLAVCGFFYLAAGALAALPLLALTAGFKGSMLQKARQYIASNTPSNQMLTLLSCANVGLALAAWFPRLAGYHWWIYVVAMFVLFIKPFCHVFLAKE